MKTLLGIFLALGMLVAVLPGVAAQEADSAFADGIGQTAIYTNDQGEMVAALTVTEVDNDFLDYPEGQAADFGYTYRAVSLTVENLTDEAIIVEPNQFLLFDSWGNSNYQTVIPSGDESTDRYNERYALAPGETSTPRMIFSVPRQAETAMLVWQPEYSSMVIVNLTEGAAESGATVRGMNTPAMITDDFGNPVASIKITDITAGWDEYTEYDAPDDGITYHAVHFSVTNETDRPVEVSASRFYMIDEHGNSIRTASVRSEDDAQEVFRPDTVAPGETLEGMVVFEIAGDVDLVAFQWQNYSTSSATIILAESTGNDAIETATPGTESTPVAGA